MATPPPFRTMMLLVLAGLITAGCSGKTEDVRFKLCKEVTERLLESMGPVTWKRQSSEIRRAGDAMIRLELTVGSEGRDDRPVTSACFFKHDLPEESALDHVDPLAAYATLPYMMTINETPVPDDILKKAVSAEQLEGFREFFDRIRREIERLPIVE